MKLKFGTDNQSMAVVLWEPVNEKYKNWNFAWTLQNSYSRHNFYFV